MRCGVVEGKQGYFSTLAHLIDRGVVEASLTFEMLLTASELK